jgi:hypothetical protein
MTMNTFFTIFLYGIAVLLATSITAITVACSAVVVRAAYGYWKGE